MRKTAGGFDVPKPTLDKVPQPTGPFTILGKPAGSSIEWNVAMALDKLKVTYSYQYRVFGGRTLKGGTVIDFMVHTVPLDTPLYVQGDYWHGSAKKRELDQWMMRRIRAALYYKCGEPVEIWEHDALTIDMAMTNLRRILHI